MQNRNGQCSKDVINVADKGTKLITKNRIIRGFTSSRRQDSCKPVKHLTTGDNTFFFVMLGPNYFFHSPPDPPVGLIYLCIGEMQVFNTAHFP